MAQFAHLFGIRPWEWDLLSVREAEGLMAAVDAWEQANSG